MFFKQNPWKLLTAIVAAFVAIVCGSGASKAFSEPITKSTVEQRIAKVREALVDREQHLVESNLDRSEPSDLQSKEEEELLSQYWSNWGNYWNNY